MAKFCANCGAQMDDDDRVCGQCGTPFAEEQVVINEPSEEPAAPVIEEPAAPVAEATVEATPAEEPIVQPAAEAVVQPAAEAVVPPVQPNANQNGNAGQANPNINAGQVNPNINAAAKPANNANFIIFGVLAGIFAIVAIVVAVNILSNFTGYKGTLNKMCKALKNYDIDELENLASSINEEIIEDYYGRNKDPYDVYEDRVSDVLDNFEDRVGEIKKISYEVTDFKEYSDRRVRDIEDGLVDEYNMDTDSIKKIAEVELKLTVKGKKKSASYNVDNLYMIKEGSKWKLLYGNLDY